jgi:DNA polymerase-3 subunit delta'
MFIVGHQMQRRKLREQLVAGTLAPTLLLTGAPGLGKRLVASELCCALLCEKETDPGTDKSTPGSPCLNCNGCRAFQARNHPDAYRLDCSDRATWNTGAIRELLFNLHLASFSGSNRTVLIDNADLMPVQAANALLKSLEEPRPGLYFVLITANRSRLPQTLLSRCQTWFFDSLSISEVLEVLNNSSDPHLQELLAESPSEREVLAKFSDGSMQNVLYFLEQAELVDEIKKTLARASSGKLAATAEIAAGWGRDKELLPIRLHLIRLIARKLLLDSKSPEDQSRWAELLSSTLQIEALVLARNLNASYLIDLMLQRLNSPGSPLSTTYPTPIPRLVS